MRRGDLLRPPGLSHAEIAELLGVSRAMVQQIEERALRKLRLLMQWRGLTAESVRP